MKAVTAGLALVAAALLAGCTRSHQAEATKAKAALASWQATRWLLDEQRARGVLPEQYVRQVIRAVEEGRTQALAQLREAYAP